MTILPLIILVIENDGDRAFMEKLYLDHYRLMRAAARKVLMTGEDSVKQAILRLSERDRLALTMKYFDDLSDAEIARALGVGKNSVRPMLMRARRRMREAIGE